VFPVRPEEGLQEVACGQFLALPLGLEHAHRRGPGKALAQPVEDSEEMLVSSKHLHVSLTVRQHNRMVYVRRVVTHIPVRKGCLKASQHIT
jgi:hypothetical protein